VRAFRHDRDSFGWHYGWIGQRYWLSVCSIRGRMVCLDVGPYRIRWAGPDHHPLFSERYGYTRWYGLGRLKVNRASRAKKAAATEEGL
jgi:hypothetical protein